MAIHPGPRRLNATLDAMGAYLLGTYGIGSVGEVRSLRSGTVKVQSGTVNVAGINEIQSLRNGTAKISENWSIRNGTVKVPEVWSIRNGTIKANVTEIQSLRNGTTKVSELWSLRNGTTKISENWSIRNGTVKVPEVWSLRNGTVKGFGGYLTSITNATCKLPNGIPSGTVKVSENWSIRNGTVKVSEVWSLRSGTVRIPGGTINIAGINEIISLRNGTVKVSEVLSIRDGTVKTNVTEIQSLRNGTTKVSELWSLRNGTVKVSEVLSLRNGTVKTTVGTVKVSSLGSGTVKVRGDYLTSITNATCKLPNGIPSGTIKVPEVWSLRNGTAKISELVSLRNGTVKMAGGYLTSLANATCKISEVWSLRRGTITGARLLSGTVQYAQRIGTVQKIVSGLLGTVNLVRSLTNATVHQGTRASLKVMPERDDLLYYSTNFYAAGAGDTLLVAGVANQYHRVYACGYEASLSRDATIGFRFATNAFLFGYRRNDNAVYVQSFPHPVKAHAVNTALNIRRGATGRIVAWVQIKPEA